jgi:hypothetical protein
MPLQWMVITIAVVVLIGSAAFGGLAAAHPAGPATASPGHAIDGLPWDVTIVDTRIQSSLTGLTALRDGDRFLIVAATVTITSPDARSDLSNALRLHGATGLVNAYPSAVLLQRDGTALNFLNPGMTERLEFAWEQAAGAPIPTSVEVGVFDEEQKPDLGGNLAWFPDDQPIAVVHSTVEAKQA